MMQVIRARTIALLSKYAVEVVSLLYKLLQHLASFHDHHLNLERYMIKLVSNRLIA